MILQCLSIYPGLDFPNQFPSDCFAVASIYHCQPGRLCCMLFVQVRQGISPAHPGVCHAALDPFISLPRCVIAWNIPLWCHFCSGGWSNWSYVSQLTQHEQHHSSQLDSLECIHYPTGRFRKSPTLHQHKKICTGVCMGMFVQPLLCHDVVCVRTFKVFLQFVVVCVHQQQNKFYSSTTGTEKLQEAHTMFQYTIWMIVHPTCGVVICNPFISDILLFIS